MTCLAYTADGWGVGELWFEGTQLVWHEPPRPSANASTGTRARARVTPTRQGGVYDPPPSTATIPSNRALAGHGNAPEVENLLNRIVRYFAGERVSFEDVDLDLDGWTPFQCDVVRALRRVRYGEVVSYGDLARLAGHPRAQRAAGTFCARNRFAVIVPCHRVVAADGLGSYGSLGLDYKKRLLALEGVAV